MHGKPKIKEPFGDNPVLDILGIAYEDFVQGRTTKIEKLIKIMNYTYTKYRGNYIRRLINIIINSQHWFNKPTQYEVHLIERGVEVYLNMLAAREAEEANRKANLIIAFAIFTAILTLILVVLTIKLL